MKTLIKPTQRVALIVLLAAIVIIASIALVYSRAQPKAAVGPQSQQLVEGKQASRKGPRNLILQREAFNLSRVVGQRFSPVKRERSVMVAAITTGSGRRTVQITRAQTDEGEQVEISLEGAPESLSWDANQGTLSARRRAPQKDRELIERLVHDSPDQFVLAQLRGASYFTVARNVRPADAGDNYSGPLWNIVRVNDPEKDETKRAQSLWRLYYLNATTGLIDRIESETDGQRIVAVISSWAEYEGEKVASQITWTRQGQTLMEYSLTNFSHAAE